MSAGAAPSEPDHDAADPLIGAEIAGRYEVHRRIARGGMGSVYRGVHVELGRPVAIKVLKDDYARDDEAVRRFQREARTASRIDHPNIVAVLDLGRLESGEPYLVMEVLEGEDLADIIEREAPLPPSRVVEILTPVASALDAVHREGLLHRDIKPANIFLAKRPDGSVVPKLLDFGLASLREPSDHDRLTREGIVVGTPHYVSPEAAEGEAVDERTDVYSLGLVAFEMLSGVLPIDGQRPMSLLYAKVRRPAPTLTERTGRAFPPPIEQLVSRTLSRTPAKRPASAGAFLRELADIVRSLPADATQIDLPSTGPASEREVKESEATIQPSSMQLPLERRRGALSIGIALLLATLLGAGLWFARDRLAPEEHARPAPIVPPPATAHEAHEAREAPAAPVEPALTTGARAHQEPAPPETEAQAPHRPPARASSEERASRRERAAPPPEPQRSAAPPARPPEPIPDTARADALTRQAGTALLRGQFPRARQLFQQATYADAHHAAAWRGLGLASERMGMTPEARSAYRRYLALAPGASDAGRVRTRLARLDEGSSP